MSTSSAEKRVPVENGDVCEGYRWTQTLQDVTLHVDVPEGTVAKALDVVITASRIKVGLKGSTPILEGQLHKTVHSDDSFWSLVDRKSVQVTLQKVKDMEWWPRLIVGGPEIDVSKVEPENSKIQDLDGETQKTVLKMMENQRRKAAGLPSVEDEQKQDMLKKFMASHPEMDFSQAKIN
eukprot:ANDGO_03146.mRNA.1 Protein BOBBER 1